MAHIPPPAPPTVPHRRPLTVEELPDWAVDSPSLDYDTLPVPAEYVTEPLPSQPARDRKSRERLEASPVHPRTQPKPVARPRAEPKPKPVAHPTAGQRPKPAAPKVSARPRPSLKPPEAYASRDRAPTPCGGVRPRPSVKPEKIKSGKK